MNKLILFLLLACIVYAQAYDIADELPAVNQTLLNEFSEKLREYAAKFDDEALTKKFNQFIASAKNKLEQLIVVEEADGHKN